MNGRLFAFSRGGNGMASENKPIERGTLVRYKFEQKEFVGTVIDAGFYVLWVRVIDSAKEHFIRYTDVIAVLGQGGSQHVKHQ
jgi:hypothetical protein